MFPVRSLVAALALSVALLAPNPAAAQATASLDNWSHVKLPGLDELATGFGLMGAGFYVGLGTVAFVAADVHYVAHEKPLPRGLAIAQGVFGATVIAAGGACVTNGIPEGAALFAVGGGLIAAPLVDWGIRGARRQHQTAVRVSPTGVMVSGRF